MKKNDCFIDKATFDKIYSEYLENMPQSSQEVRDSYKKMWDCFEEYLSATQEGIFRYAYQCGYEAAKEENLEPNIPTYLLKGGVTV